MAYSALAGDRAADAFANTEAATCSGGSLPQAAYSTVHVLSPSGFHQYDVPGTRPDKIDLAVLLITIKEYRCPRLIELLILAQFGKHEGFPNRSSKRTAGEIVRTNTEHETQQTRLEEVEFRRLYEPFADIGKKGFE
jgi:hypothetical protein